MSFVDSTPLLSPSLTSPLRALSSQPDAETTVNAPPPPRRRETITRRNAGDLSALALPLFTRAIGARATTLCDSSSGPFGQKLEYYITVLVLSQVGARWDGAHWIRARVNTHTGRDRTWTTRGQRLSAFCCCTGERCARPGIFFLSFFFAVYRMGILPVPSPRQLSRGDMTADR